MMKKAGAVVALLLLGASSAGAVDIQGKWGIGAGVFGGGGEVSLIRGRSERSAWLLELQLSGDNSNRRSEFSDPAVAPSRSNQNFFAISGGPGLRRFTRPEAEFSPYYDLSLRGTYDRSHFSVFENRTNVGAGARFSFGLEYFTRWHFSVAAHSSVANLGWRHSRMTYQGARAVDRSSGFSADVALRPALFVRAYF
jgi:hypothetical protein